MNREDYKMTEFGEIPQEWEIKKIGDISIFVGSGVTPKGGQSVYKTEGIPFIRSQNVYPDGLILDDVAYIDEEQNERMKRTEFRDKDILLNITGASIGRCAVVPDGFGRGNVNQHVCIIRVEGVNQKYISLFLNSQEGKRQIDSFNGGSSREGLNFQQVRSIKVILPTVKEQENIADILSTVEKDIKKTDVLIEKTKELKKGLMQRLLTKGIGHTEFKDTEIGRIPKEWEVKRLGEIVQICYGKNQKEVETVDGIYKILGTGGVIGNTNHYLWDKPSVLIGRKGTIDKPMYIEEPFWTVDTLFYTKVNEGYVAKWLYYYLNKIDLKKYNEATGVPSLSVAVLNKILILVPPFKEQQKISEILSAVDSEIDIYESRKNKMEDVKKVLMNHLLTGKIRVLV